MRVDALGDQAVMAYCTGEAEAFNLAQRCRGALPPWVVDVVQAYTTVALFYDPEHIDFDGAAAALIALGSAPYDGNGDGGRLRRVPCCYDLGPDVARVAEHTGRSADMVVAIHAATCYTVYAIGFCPGFPYLGYLADAIAGVPRLPAPRLRVDAGSVGLTGRQTGIYTEARPGGWNIIGRTPLTLVDVADGYFPLRTGDRVQFAPIDHEEYRRRLGERLDVGE